MGSWEHRRRCHQYSNSIHRPRNYKIGECGCSTWRPKLLLSPCCVSLERELVKRAQLQEGRWGLMWPSWWLRKDKSCSRGNSKLIIAIDILQWECWRYLLSSPGPTPGLYRWQATPLRAFIVICSSRRRGDRMHTEDLMMYLRYNHSRTQLFHQYWCSLYRVEAIPPLSDTVMTGRTTLKVYSLQVRNSPRFHTQDTSLER